jgi:hypothetical protein
MNIELSKMLDRSRDKVQAVLNILLESPCFYLSDDQDLFYFLRRHRREFNEFFTEFYGWQLLMDGKCARVFKENWYNKAITPANRAVFNFSRRDECLAFMMLLEFFELQLEKNNMTVEDRDNLRFYFADLLQHVHRRFQEFDEEKTGKYTEESVRAKILKPIMPQLERFRFIKKIPPPKELRNRQDELIYEALPAIYHYNTAALSRILPELGEKSNVEPGDSP